MSMNYVVRQVGDVTVLDLSGRISLGEALAFGPGSALILHELVRDQVKNGSKKILLNLAGVTYVDSSGLGELVSSATTVQSQGGLLRLSGVTPRISDLLRMTHMDKVLNIDQDEAAALRAFSDEPKQKTSAA